MQPKYTPEQRKMFPESVGVIIRKNKPSMVIDPSLVREIVDAINSNDFVFINDYNTTLHKFDIDEICIKKVKDPERDLIMKLIQIKNDNKFTNPLSFNDSLTGLAKQNYLN